MVSLEYPGDVKNKSTFQRDQVGLVSEDLRYRFSVAQMFGEFGSILKNALLKQKLDWLLFVQFWKNLCY